MTVGERLARFFVAPVAEVGEEVRWLPPGSGPRPASLSVASVAVVCAPRDARIVGGAAALALAHLAGAPAVSVLEWTGVPARLAQDRPASPAARRLAAGCDAAAAGGRLVRHALEEDESAAAAQAHALLLDPSVPAVLVVAGPRGEAMERVIAEQDRVLLVTRPDADGALTALAQEHLRATPVVLPSSPGAAALARAGVALVAPLRAPFLEALR